MMIVLCLTTVVIQVRQTFLADRAQLNVRPEFRFKGLRHEPGHGQWIPEGRVLFHHDSHNPSTRHHRHDQVFADIKYKRENRSIRNNW